MDAKRKRKLPTIVRRILFCLHAGGHTRENLSRDELDYINMLAESEPLPRTDEAAHYLKQFGDKYIK